MIQLFYRGLSEIIGSEEVGLISLTDRQKERQIVVVCDKQTVHQFHLRMAGVPTTRKLMPEALLDTLKRDTGEQPYNITISSLLNGIYKTHLCNAQTGQKTEIRASDGVLLAFIGNLPIYIDEELFARQSVSFAPHANGLSLPINAISEDMLHDALKTAIDKENYELAEQLNSELKRRRNKNIQDKTDA